MVVGLLGNRSSYLNRFTLIFQSLKMMYDYKLNLTVRTPRLARGSSQEYTGEELPEDFICPLCKHPVSDFEEVTE